MRKYGNTNCIHQTKQGSSTKEKLILRNNGMYLEPGWSWDKCVKPIAKTKSCMVAIHYLSYQEKVSQDLDVSEEEH